MNVLPCLFLFDIKIVDQINHHYLLQKRSIVIFFIEPVNSERKNDNMYHS